MNTLAKATEFEGVKINQFENGIPFGYHLNGYSNWTLTYYHQSWDYPSYYPHKSTERQMKNQLVKLFRAEGLIK